MIAVLLSVGLLAHVDGGESALSASGCDFEDVYAFSSVECSITVRNLSSRVVYVTAKPKESGDAILPTSVDIPAHAETSLKVRANVGHSAGEFTRFFDLQERASGKTTTVRVNGFALSALDDPNPHVFFGKLDANAPSPTKRIAIDSHEIADFRVLRIIEKPAWANVNLAAGGRAIDVELRSDAPWGRLDGIIKLELNSPNQPQAWVSVNAEIDGEIRPKENRFWMGFLSDEKKGDVSLPLKNTSGKNDKFKFGAVKIEGIKGEGKIVPCAPQSDGCALLQMDLSQETKTGVVQGSVSIDLPDYNRQLRVVIWGMLNRARQGADISFSELKKEDASDESKDGLSSSSSAKISGGRDSDLTTASPVKDVKEVSGPLLKWSVKDDGGAYGYQIFRSQRKDGPFLMISPRLIRAVGHVNGLSKYEWRDESAKINQTYWYYIGVVGKDGAKRKLSEPQEKFVKSDEK